MTAADVALSWVRDFEAKLSPQARRRLERDPAVTQLIVKAIEAGWSVDKLAETVGYGIAYQQPVNARDVMIWRLRRAIDPDTDGVTS